MTVDGNLISETQYVGLHVLKTLNQNGVDVTVEGNQISGNLYVRVHVLTPNSTPQKQPHFLS